MQKAAPLEFVITYQYPSAGMHTHTQKHTHTHTLHTYTHTTPVAVTLGLGTIVQWDEHQQQELRRTLYRTLAPSVDIHTKIEITNKLLTLQRL